MSINYFPDETRCPKCNTIATPEETHCAICNTSLEQSQNNKSSVPKSEGIEAVFSKLDFLCPNCGNVETLGANICSSCGHSLESKSLKERKSKVISIVNRISHKKPKVRGKQQKSPHNTSPKPPSKSALRNQQSRKTPNSTKSLSNTKKRFFDYFSFNKKMLVSCGISVILGSTFLLGLDGENSLDHPHNLLSDDVKVETKTLSYGGSLCLVSLFRQDIESAIKAQNPQYNMKYKSPSSRKNPYPCSFDIDPLLEEEVDFIISNRHVSIKKLKKKYDLMVLKLPKLLGNLEKDIISQEFLTFAEARNYKFSSSISNSRIRSFVRQSFQILNESQLFGSPAVKNNCESYSQENKSLNEVASGTNGASQNELFQDRHLPKEGTVSAELNGRGSTVSMVVPPRNNNL